MSFERTRQPPGAWPFKCKVLVSCNKLSQQICGCEVEGTEEKAALVYHVKENGQPGNGGIFVSINTITESINLFRLKKYLFLFPFLMRIKK